MWQWLGYVPTIVLSPVTTATSESATVSFRTAEFGRPPLGPYSDQMVLPFRRVPSSSLPIPVMSKFGMLAEKLTKQKG